MTFATTDLCDDHAAMLDDGPLFFGALMDGDHPALLFVFIGIFQALAIATAVGVGGKTRAAALQKA